MDSEIKEQLTTGILAIIRRLESAEKFALEQMPHICAEVVIESIIEHSTWLVFSSLMIGSGLGLLFVKHEWAGWAGGSLILVGTLAATGSLVGLLKAKMTPKLVVLERLQAMISPPEKDE